MSISLTVYSRVQRASLAEAEVGNSASATRQPMVMVAPALSFIVHENAVRRGWYSLDETAPTYTPGPQGNVTKPRPERNHTETRRPYLRSVRSRAPELH